MKPRHDNNVIDRIGAFYVKKDTKLLWPIRSDVDCEENQIGKLCTNHTNAVYLDNKTELAWSIGSRTIFDEN